MVRNAGACDMDRRIDAVHVYDVVRGSHAAEGGRSVMVPMRHYEPCPQRGTPCLARVELLQGRPSDICVE